MNSTQVQLMCRDCDDLGRRPNRSECSHSDVYAAIAARGAAAARAAVRSPKLPTTTTGDLP